MSRPSSTAYSSHRVVAAGVLGGQVGRDGDGLLQAQRSAPVHVPGDVVGVEAEGVGGAERAQQPEAGGGVVADHAHP
ncbi:hypothetical protein ACH4KT_26710 [Streptomyces anulatus]